METNPVPNLIQKLTEMFAAEGVVEPAYWETKLPRIAFDTPDADYRRFLVNSFWRNTLGLVTLKKNTGDRNTMDARYSLVDKNIDDEHLLHTYRLNVLPWIKEFALPQSLQSPVTTTP